jgi:hypothetical protein
MPAIIKKLYLLFPLSLPFFTTCENKIPFNIPSITTYETPTFIVAEFPNKTSYSFNKFAFNQYQKYSCFLHPRYKTALKNPETILNCLSEIDNNNDRTISFLEALSSSTSKEKISNLTIILEKGYLKK